jgi:hypothetical protein
MGLGFPRSSQFQQCEVYGAIPRATYRAIAERLT